VLDRNSGLKKVAIRAVADGGTVEEAVAAELVEAPCLDDDQLAQLHALAGRCEEVYGPSRDIEWAIAGNQLYLLQCRAVTRAGASPTKPPAADSSLAVIGEVPFFEGLSERDVAHIAGMFKERRFAAGETITKEGAGAAAFFVIDSGEVAVTVHSKQIATLGRGDFFGEMALIDEGARSATVTAMSDVVCHGLTYWEFRPLVQTNATIAWNLLRTLAKRLRTAQED
jgi:hypothetical protein